MSVQAGHKKRLATISMELDEPPKLASDEDVWCLFLELLAESAQLPSHPRTCHRGSQDNPIDLTVEDDNRTDHPSARYT